ncbi:hypothetical protein O7626_05900 [Micromonospora sp. WMMD1102]|uniref:hypothetical protein n=1 Tax=Micromonospora sp. WMMD1102 TaxID=3016105 RepID=UPI002414F425|nr:hypothetical protein [Micromonospora sp. WMMD1102]MDG4785470.1 hypothetical protein [Micromonospora sp. WMMD1102]
MGGSTDGSAAIAVPTREFAAEVAIRLEADGSPAVEIGPDGRSVPTICTSAPCTGPRVWSTSG